jgi:hypothetical protein
MHHMTRRYNFLFLYVAMALYAGFFSYNHLLTGEWEEASFRRLVDGTATTPMQYRVLVPWLARLLEPAIPYVPLISHINGIRKGFALGSTLLLLLVFYRFIQTLILTHYASIKNDDRGTLACCSVYLLMLVLPFHFLTPRIHDVWYYPSDVPSLLFFTLGMWTLHKKQWRLYYPIFMLATFNRETSCFLTIYMLLLMLDVKPFSRLLGHVVFQAMLWVAIKVVLYKLYEINTNIEYADVGGVFKFTLMDNMSQNWLKTLVLLPSVYGLLWIPLIYVAATIRPYALRRALLVIPIFHLLMIIPGEIFELRIYAEMIPVVIAGLVMGTCTYMSKRVAGPDR